MPTHRYAVLLCRDAADGFTAIPLDGGRISFAASAAQAKTQLRDYLLWMHKEEPREPGPDFGDGVLTWHTLAIKPEYRTKDRLHPSEKAVRVPVACVAGKRANGQTTAALPLLDVHFDCADPKEVPELVQRYARQKLGGLTPEELSRFLPPSSVELIEIPIRVPRAAAAANRSTIDPPMLKQVAESLTDRAVRKGFARAWGREAEVASLAEKLHRDKANILLVGEPGVGKTTLIVDAVKQAAKLKLEPDQETDATGDKRFWLSSAGRIVAGMKYLGQWEERVETVIGELGEIKGVLCVERLLGLVQRGGQGPSDGIAAFLMPYLARGELRMLAESTPAELAACRRLLPGLADAFQIVRVDAFDRPRALAVLDRQLETAASGHRIEVARGTGERIVRLFRRFQPYAAFPGPASAFARDLIRSAVRDGVKEVDAARAVERFQARTGLPELFLRDELTLEREEVLRWFGERVIDQPAACQAAADVVMGFKAGLNDTERPLAVLLFCGPTGVGKTHMAMALAEYFFEHGDLQGKPGESPRLIRLDMSEYGGYDAVHRLFGPPTGEPGELVKRIRREPFSVVLLDEIEKASAPVFDTLMGVFDEGRLTDQYGRETNFRSSIMLMTSNLGAGSSSALGFASGPRAPAYREAAMEFFRPEFFNRMDDVVQFAPLTPESVNAIARRELAAIAKREGIARLGIHLEFGDGLVERIADIGFDARYGARPLQRAVERLVVAELAKWIVAHPPEPGHSIRGEWTGDRVTWS